MNPQCAKCKKTVYPMEKLNSLDKFWHKGCFKCEVCNMTLNMKNYKGYNKLPYCSAHYPTTKFTAVADTPENMRIAKNTKVQSNIQYHADFEKEKGKYTTVAEDPEVERIKKNTQHQSNVQYWGLKEQRESMETRRPTETVDDVTRRGRNPGKISDYNPVAETADFDSPYSKRTSANVVYDSQRGEGPGSPTSPTGGYGQGPHSPTSPPGGYVRQNSNTNAPFSYGGDRSRASQQMQSLPSPTYTERNSYPDSNPSRNSTSSQQRFSYTTGEDAMGNGNRNSGIVERNSGIVERNSGHVNRNSGNLNPQDVNRSSGYSEPQDGSRNSGYTDPRE